MQISFIGTGVMGAPMAQNLAKKGFDVKAYNRTYAKAQAIKADHITAYEDLVACVKDSDIIITMVGYPRDVEECYDKIMPNAKKGAVLIDMTTSSPSLALKLGQKAQEYGLAMLDAPVSGGDIGAKEANLTIMVGGEKKSFDKCRAVFEAMGSNVTYIGGWGSGQHAKMANQILIAANIAGVMESLSYMAAQGLDREAVIKAVSSGSAASFQLNYATKKIKEKDFEPGFYIKHFVKDMTIAQNEASQKKIVLPILDRVLESFKYLLVNGYGDLGTQALYYYYQKS